MNVAAPWGASSNATAHGWPTAQRGIIDRRPARFDERRLIEGRALRMAIATARSFARTRQCAAFKIGMCSDVVARWRFYVDDRVWTHLVVLQQCSTREAASYVEAALIMAMDGWHNQTNMNYWTRDVGGEGPVGRGRDDLYTHFVYIVLAPVRLGVCLRLDRPLKQQMLNIGADTP